MLSLVASPELRSDPQFSELEAELARYFRGERPLTNKSWQWHRVVFSSLHQLLYECVLAKSPRTQARHLSQVHRWYTRHVCSSKARFDSSYPTSRDTQRSTAASVALAKSVESRATRTLDEWFLKHREHQRSQRRNLQSTKKLLSAWARRKRQQQEEQLRKSMSSRLLSRRKARRGSCTGQTRQETHPLHAVLASKQALAKRRVPSSVHSLSRALLMPEACSGAALPQPGSGLISNPSFSGDKRVSRPVQSRKRT